MAEGSQFESGMVKNFLFSTSPEPVLGPTENTYPMGTVGFFSGGKVTVAEGDHSPSSGAEVKKISMHPLPHTSSWCNA
jgi:hypothetical protein